MASRNNRDLFFNSSRGQKSKIKVSAEIYDTSSKGSREGSFLASPYILVTASYPWHSSLPSLPPSFYGLLCVSLYPNLLLSL